MKAATGHDVTFCDQQMSWIEAKVWEQIYWHEWEQRRRDFSMNKLAPTRIVSAYENPQDEVI